VPADEVLMDVPDVIGKNRADYTAKAPAVTSYLKFRMAARLALPLRREVDILRVMVITDFD